MRCLFGYRVHWLLLATGILLMNTLFIQPIAWSSQKKVAETELESLSVRIDGLRNEKGFLIVMLFDEGNASSYPKEAESVAGILTLKVDSKTMLATFPSLPQGKYAVFAIHDENKNSKLDTNFVGRPKEGTAASNDAHGFMGPPKFDKAAFDLESDGTEIKISVRYL